MSLSHLNTSQFRQTIAVVASFMLVCILGIWGFVAGTALVASTLWVAVSDIAHRNTAHLTNLSHAWLAWSIGAIVLSSLLGVLTRHAQNEQITFEDHALDAPPANDVPFDPAQWRLVLQREGLEDYSVIITALHKTIGIPIRAGEAVARAVEERGSYVLWAGQSQEVQYLARKLKAEGLNIDIVPGVHDLKR